MDSDKENIEIEVASKTINKKGKPVERNYFPTNAVFTISKLSEVVDFFSKTGNVPLTKEQMKDKFKDIGNFENVLDRIVNFCWKNTIIFSFSKSDKKYSLKKDVYYSLKTQKLSLEEVIREEIRKSKGYLLIFRYIKEEKLDELFFLEHFMDYLKKSKIGFNESGLVAWFNFLKAINLVAYNIQTKQAKLLSAGQKEEKIEVGENAVVEANPTDDISKHAQETELKKIPEEGFIAHIKGVELNFDLKINTLSDIDDLEAIIKIMRRKIGGKKSKE